MKTKPSADPLENRDAEETAFQQRKYLQEIARGYRQAQILITCVEFGIFEVLAGQRASAQEIAEAVGASPRGMERLLNAATDLSYVE